MIEIRNIDTGETVVCHLSDFKAALHWVVRFRGYKEMCLYTKLGVNFMNEVAPVVKNSMHKVPGLSITSRVGPSVVEKRKYYPQIIGE